MRRQARSMLFLFVVVAPLAAQVASQEQYCQSLTSAVAEGGALSRMCEYARTLQQRLPDVICERIAKTYYHERLRQTVTAEVRHANGRDSYRNIVRNGLPFGGAMSELPGSWSEGEFGSVLEFIFAESSHTQFTFEKETKWKSTPALLFSFRVAQENNRAWFIEVNHRRAYPGIKGRVWVDASSGAALRMEIEAEHLKQAGAAAQPAGDGGATGATRKPAAGPPFLLDSYKKTIDFASVHLADGSDFVLPITSEERKCLIWGACFRDQLSFTNCHKFTVKSRIVDDVR